MLLDLLLGTLTIVGHGATVVFISNRIHATGLPRRFLRLVTFFGHGTSCVVAAAVAAWWAGLWGQSYGHAWESLPLPVVLYGGFCCLVAIGPVPWILVAKWLFRPPVELLSESRQRHDLRSLPAVACGLWGKCVVRFPLNETLLLDVSRKELAVRKLDPRLDGLRVAHISDLHFTGRIGKPYFVEVVRIANDLACDLVAITGDLLDRNECLDWLPETLGRLRAEFGVYFVLGNHDLRVNFVQLVQRLQECGCTYLGGKSVRRMVRDCPVILAGNERPWFKPAADLTELPEQTAGQRALRIGLSHSPDQIVWARKHELDLLLAGHLHGGQIRLPLIGPLLAPSRYGVRYSSGTFYVPPTLLHVSRGVSGKTPLRWRCPPEISELVLRAGGQ